MPSRLYDRPIVAALAGALAISFSGILFRAAHVSPSTGRLLPLRSVRCRCSAAVLLEDRRFGPRPLRAARARRLAGVFFAIDLIAWHEGIEQVGAGLATVLGNLQVVFVGLLAWMILGERPSNRSLAAIPVALVGVLLISGVFESGAYGKNPGLGVAYGILTALAYSGFLLVLRASNRDWRRPAGPLFDATLVSGFTTIPIGLAIGNLDWTPGWPAWGYLLLLGLELPGARLAADLDHAPAPAGCDDLGAADLPARARRCCSRGRSSTRRRRRSSSAGSPSCSAAC